MRKGLGLSRSYYSRHVNYVHLYRINIWRFYQRLYQPVPKKPEESCRMVYTLKFTVHSYLCICSRKNILFLFLPRRIPRICIGYWAVFVTIASEQFGTNMRSTVTT